MAMLILLNKILYFEAFCEEFVIQAILKLCMTVCTDIQWPQNYLDASTTVIYILILPA